MNKLTHTAIINSGIRGFLCAGLTTVVTASFSWSFVASTKQSRLDEEQHTGFAGDGHDPGGLLSRGKESLMVLE